MQLKKGFVKSTFNIKCDSHELVDKKINLRVTIKWHALVVFFSTSPQCS